jgi:hypothetical protein
LLINICKDVLRRKVAGYLPNQSTALRGILGFSGHRFAEGGRAANRNAEFFTFATLFRQSLEYSCLEAVLKQPLRLHIGSLGFNEFNGK